MFQGLDMMQ